MLPPDPREAFAQMSLAAAPEAADPTLDDRLERLVVALEQIIDPARGAIRTVATTTPVGG